jgi:hypothetical protein
VRASQPAPREPIAAQPVSRERDVARAADEREPSAPPVNAAVSGPHAQADVLQEPQQIASAERLLASAPARALAIVRVVEARFPDSYLREERAYVEVMALLGLGRAAEARSRAEAFLTAYPDGPYSRRVRSAVSSAQP